MVVIGELFLVLSTKYEASKPFGTTADFIGATFDVSTPARPVFRPMPWCIYKLQESVYALQAAAGRLLPL